MAQHLLSPLKVGSYTLKNRVLMAPMTRSRAAFPDLTATPLMAEYYAQRASAGLIITEGTQVSQEGIGYIATPGIHSEAQIAGWKQVTDAVHAKGGLIFAQLWHVGRVSHPDLLGGALPVSASAVGFNGTAYTFEGPKQVVTPRALELSEIPRVIGDFVHAAKAAQAAGFDGVEIHGANGYLVTQFLEDGSNQRTDQYGGSIENRARFLLELTREVVAVWGPGKVGVRISPNNGFNGMSDSNPVALYTYVAQELDKLPLAYLHVLEAVAGMMAAPAQVERATPSIRKVYKGVLIGNGGYTADQADDAIATGRLDAVAFGVPFLANPDLPERFAQKAPLNTPDQATFYGGSEKGYTDYPTLAGA